jgi:hypothetical protein
MLPDYRERERESRKQNQDLQTVRCRTFFNHQKTKSKQQFLKPLHAKLAIHIKIMYLCSVISPFFLMQNIPVCVLITSVYFIISSVTLNKLYYTRFYLQLVSTPVKSHHQAINKNYKNGSTVCYIMNTS